FKRYASAELVGVLRGGKLHNGDIRACYRGAADGIVDCPDAEERAVAVRRGRYKKMNAGRTVNFGRTDSVDSNACMLRLPEIPKICPGNRPCRVGIELTLFDNFYLVVEHRAEISRRDIERQAVVSELRVIGESAGDRIAKAGGQRPGIPGTDRIAVIR